MGGLGNVEENERRNRDVDGGIFDGQLLIEIVTSRSPLHARAEEHLRQLRISKCEHQKVYVIPLEPSIHAAALRQKSIQPKSRKLLHPGARVLTYPPQTTGVRRPSEERPPVPAACALSSSFPASSATVSSRAHQRAPVAPRPPHK